MTKLFIIADCGCWIDLEIGCDPITEEYQIASCEVTQHCRDRKTPNHETVDLALEEPVVNNDMADLTRAFFRVLEKHTGDNG